MHTRGWIGLGAAALLAAGCGRTPDRPAADAAEVEALQGRLAALERKVTGAAQAEKVAADLEMFRWEIQALTGHLARLEADLAAAGAAAERRQAGADRRLDELALRVDQNRAVVELLRARLARTEPGEAPRTGGSPTPVISTAALADDEWAARVFDVRGEKVQTGTHTAQRKVETDESYRDAFGQIRKRQKTETYEVPEYSYQVVFAVQNLVPRDRRISVRAGATPTNFVLAAGATLTNVTVLSAVGANLSLEIDEKARTFRVLYPQL